jgi:hypothetical protein
VLILLDDPGVDRYRVSLEICERMKRGFLFNPPVNPRNDHVGLVIGFASQLGAVANSKVYSMESIGYSEFDQEGKAPDQRIIQLRHLAVLEQNPLLSRGELQQQGLAAQINPVIPGPAWRKITVEITPKSINCREPDLGKPYLVDQIRDQRKTLAGFVAKSKVRLPKLSEWSPRMPIGIWCLDAEVAFRNATIEAMK